MILEHQHSESSAIAAAFLKSLRNKIATAKADISTLSGSGHLIFALTMSQTGQIRMSHLNTRV